MFLIHYALLFALYKGLPITHFILVNDVIERIVVNYNIFNNRCISLSQ